MGDDKIEILKKLQESELSSIKGAHERAVARLHEQHSQELEHIKKKHEAALKITENRIVTTRQSE